MPLGDPHAGLCSAAVSQEPVEVPDARVRTCCNAGYAKGCCPSFPHDDMSDTPDTVRFGIVQRAAGIVVIRYVLERDHHPHRDGTLELRESGNPIDSTLIERQARAFLNSYLRRTR